MLREKELADRDRADVTAVHHRDTARNNVKRIFSKLRKNSEHSGSTSASSLIVPTIEHINEEEPHELLPHNHTVKPDTVTPPSLAESSSPVKVTRVTENSEQHALIGWKRLTAAAKEASGDQGNAWKKIIAQGRAAKEAEKLAAGAANPATPPVTAGAKPTVSFATTRSPLAKVTRQNALVENDEDSPRFVQPSRDSPPQDTSSSVDWSPERVERATEKLTNVIADAISQLSALQGHVQRQKLRQTDSNKF